MDLEFIPFTVEADDDDDNNINEENHNEIIVPQLLTTVPAPWLNTTNNKNISPFVKLHNEILTFTDYIKPTKEEIELRNLAINDINNIITKLYPNCIIKIFGSELTKLLIPTSDIDIILLNIPENLASHPNDIYINIANMIKYKYDHMFSYVEAIVNAKIPIIKLDHIKSNLSIDIVINNDSGLTSSLIIKQYITDYPPLFPLALILKIFLTQRRLNETYSGGIGSYLLTLLIISFIQNKQRLLQRSLIYRNNNNNTNSKSSHKSNQKNSNNNSIDYNCCWNLGVLLLEFFNLYGNVYNYHMVGISVTNHGRYFNKRKLVQANNNNNNSNNSNNNQRPSWLYVENPENPELDVGKSSYMMPKIRRSFEHAHQVLCAALSDPKAPSYLAYVIRTDDQLLQHRNKNNRNSNSEK